MPADLVRPDLQALRVAFSEEVADAGLSVLDDIDIAPFSDVVNRVSLAAFAPEFGPGYSGRFFQRRDFLVVGAEEGATTTVGTFDVVIGRDGDQLTLELVWRFDPAIDRLAGGPTGLGGMVIEQLAVATIDNFEAALQTIALAEDPTEAASLLSSAGLLAVGDIDQRFRVTNSLGDSITYAPGEMTLRGAMSQLGGSCTGFLECVWDCMVADGFRPDPTLVLCLVEAVLWCLPSWSYPPAGAICTASYLVVICGFQYLINELLDLVFCAWGCYFAETSILVDITDLYPNPVEPNAPVFIAGTAQYDNCDVVEVATAHIYLGNWSGTASVVDGYFSRTIYAPSSEGNYDVTVVVADGQHQGSDIAVLQVEEEDDSPPGCGFDLQGTWVIYDFDEDTDQWWSKDCFRTTDEFVNGLIYVTDLSCPVTLKWRFFYPDGSQYGQDLVWYFEPGVPPPNYYWWTWGFLIDGYAMSYVLGRYHMKMYMDTGQGFQLVGNKPYVVGWEFAEGLLCQYVDPNYPYDPTGITDVFYQNDPQMYTWTKVESVAQSTMLRCRFYEPNGSLYYEVNGNNAPGYDIGDPGGPNDCWGWYKSSASINISGASAAQKCGPWTTHVEYRNPTSNVWETLYQDSFQILEAPNVVPTVSADASPSDPVEGEPITLSASALDNTYLDRVELYWSDGDWHQVTLGDDIFAGSFSDNYQIGSYPAGQEIEFYAVAVDTSDNATASEIQTIIVQSPCDDVLDVPTEYPSIQAAIVAACDGAEVVVAPGTYPETINFLGKAITVRSSDGLEVTIIDATGLNDSVIKCITNEGPDTILDGFTVTGGIGTPVDIWRLGGGMYIKGSSPTVTNCFFSGNQALGSNGLGGGMFNDESNPTVSNCVFVGNTADEGGGMANQFSDPILISCTFDANHALIQGGGLNNTHSNLTITNCTFSGNTVPPEFNGGGGMHNSNESSTVLNNCTFVNNSAWDGGGINNNNYGFLTLVSCTFTGNTAMYGGAMVNWGEAIVTNCTFSVNTAMYGGAIYNGTLFDPPLFVADSIFCENTPDHIFGDWSDNGGNCFAETCDDKNGNGIPDDCDADLDGDGSVGVSDLLILLANWGLCGDCGNCPADLNGDCSVGVGDMLILLANWG